MVATFGVLQGRSAGALVQQVRAGDAATRREIDAAPPLEAIRVTVRVRTDPERAWAVVTDFDLYGRLAPNLASVTTTGPLGPDLTRDCADRRGRSWSESCTRWEDGRRFDVAVHTGALDYPYPLRDLHGSWWVDARGDDTALGMDFVLRPIPGPRGRAFGLLMVTVFPFVLRRILRGWRTTLRRGT